METKKTPGETLFYAQQTIRLAFKQESYPWSRLNDESKALFEREASAVTSPLILLIDDMRCALFELLDDSRDDAKKIRDLITRSEKAMEANESE